MAVDSPKSTGEVPLSGLASLLLGYVVGMAALATLWPLDFRLQPLQLVIESSVEDVILNLGLLLPVGFLWRLSHPVRWAPFDLGVLLLGVTLSALLEGLQLFLPTRCASPTDVVMNGLGAWAGAGIYEYLRLRFGRAWVDRVCLALPLTKLLYLSGPLIGLEAWVASSGQASAGLLPLAAFGAVIAGALHGRGPQGDGGPTGVVRFGIGFATLFGSAIAPLWARLPKEASMLVGVSFGCAALALAIERARPYRERRFELVAVRRALPWFAIYLGLIAAQPFARGIDPHGSARGMVLLRDVAAFSVLGYMLSQLQARSLVQGWRPHRMTAIWVTAATVVFSGIRALYADVNVAQFGLLLGAGALGAVIHRAELAVVRALRGGSSDRPSGPVPGPNEVGKLGSSVPHSL